MKNLKEEIKKINKMIKSLNEQSYDDSEIDDTDASDIGDEYDNEAKRLFMSCLEQIHDLRDGDYDKSFYLELLNKYFQDKEDSDTSEDLPY